MKRIFTVEVKEADGWYPADLGHWHSFEVAAGRSNLLEKKTGCIHRVAVWERVNQ